MINNSLLEITEKESKINNQTKRLEVRVGRFTDAMNLKKIKSYFRRNLHYQYNYIDY
jgi:hypothetical protein